MAVQRYESSTKATGNDWVYGTGSDGDVTISGTVTLTSDKHYKNLNVPVGNVLLTNGFRIFVQDTATINGVVGIGSVSGNTSGVSNGTIISHTSAVSSGTVAGNNQYDSSTVSYRLGGQGGGSSDPNLSVLPEYLVKRVEAYTGLIFPSFGTFDDRYYAMYGGSQGSVGTTTTTPLSYTNSSPAPPGFTNTWPNKAGSAGSNGGHPTAGTTVGVPGGKGNTGADGTAPNPPVSIHGAGGSGGYGGGVVAIMAKTIVGSGTIMSLGMSGSAGSAAATSPKGPDGAAGSKAPDRTDHHHHSTIIHDPCCTAHTPHHHHHYPEHYSKHVHHGAGHQTVAGPTQHHHHSATSHAPCCTVTPGHHWAGGAGGAGGTGSPAITGTAGTRGGAGGGGAIIIITETTPANLNYDVRAGTTADSDTYTATSGSTYIILNS